MGLLGNSREIAVGHPSYSKSHRQVQRTKEKNAVLQRKKGESGGAVINKKAIGVNWEFEV